MTLVHIASALGTTVRTLRSKFDELTFSHAVKAAPAEPINLVLDATFFGRSYGYLCFCRRQEMIHFLEIKTESVADLRRGMQDLAAANYRFKSFTLDGKRGFIAEIGRIFPNIPIQMCHFHQKSIIRRYITDNPKTALGKAIKQLTKNLGKQPCDVWKEHLKTLELTHKDTLAEKNTVGGYAHTRCRAALRSLKTNLPYLFAYEQWPEANIPNTTNLIEGRFAHLKEKINIHRGLKAHRKKKAIAFILNSL
jgi:hypothetical protein